MATCGYFLSVTDVEAHNVVTSSSRLGLNLLGGNVYCTVILNGQTLRTSSAKRTTATVKWPSEPLTFCVGPEKQAPQLRVALWKHHPFKRDLKIGETTIELGAMDQDRAVPSGGDELPNNWAQTVCCKLHNSSAALTLHLRYQAEWKIDLFGYFSPEVVMHILSFVDAKGLCNLSAVSPHTRDLLKSSHFLWKQLFTNNWKRISVVKSSCSTWRSRCLNQRSNFATIGDALNASADGDMILLAAGIYEETLVIKNKVTLMGEGGPLNDPCDCFAVNEHDSEHPSRLPCSDEMDVDAPGDEAMVTDPKPGMPQCHHPTQHRRWTSSCRGSSPVGTSLGTAGPKSGAPAAIIRGRDLTTLVVETGGALISNLWLQQAGASSGLAYCVQFKTGESIIEHCDITSDSLSCVVIHDDANAVVRNNVIHHSQQCGVLVCGHGKGLILDNDIHSCTLAGIELRDTAAPDVIDNKIHHGLKTGVTVHRGARGLIKGCDVHDNALHGFEISDNANPTLVNNRIHHHKQDGVFLHNNGGGRFEGNQLYCNEFNGIELRDAGNSHFVRNKIFSSPSGVYIHSDAGHTAVFERNAIYDTKDAFVSSSPVTLIETTFEDIVEADVKDCVATKSCTYVNTGQVHKVQHWYHCRTCKLEDTEGCCVVCKDTCHSGHDLFYGGFSEFFCDCGSMRPCKALKRSW